MPMRISPPRIVICLLTLLLARRYRSTTWDPQAFCRERPLSARHFIHGSPNLSLSMVRVRHIIPIFVTAQTMSSAAVSDAARAPVSGPSAQRYGFAASVSPAGYWVTEDRAWTIQIIPCASGFCGRLLGLGGGPRADVLRRDIRNPVVSKRSAPLCELPVLGGFTPSQKEAGVWEGGWIYDPEH